MSAPASLADSQQDSFSKSREIAIMPRRSNGLLYITCSLFAVYHLWILSLTASPLTLPVSIIMFGSCALTLFMILEAVRSSLLPDRFVLTEDGIALGWESLGLRYKTAITPWTALSHVTIRRRDDSTTEFCFYVSSASDKRPKLRETPVHPAFWQVQRGVEEECLLTIKSSDVVDLDGCDVLLDYINQHVSRSVISEPLQQLISQSSDQSGRHGNAGAGQNEHAQGQEEYAARRDEHTTGQRQFAPDGSLLPLPSRLSEWRHIIGEHERLRINSRAVKRNGCDSASRVVQILARMDSSAPDSIPEDEISLPELRMTYRPFSIIKQLATTYVKAPGWLQFFSALLLVAAYCFSIPYTALFVFGNCLLIFLIINHLGGPSHLSLSDRALSIQCRLLSMRLWQIGFPWHQIGSASLVQNKSGKAVLVLDHGRGGVQNRFLRLSAPSELDGASTKPISIQLSALQDSEDRRNLLRALHLFLAPQSCSEELSQLLRQTSSESAPAPLAQLVDAKDQVILRYRHQRSVSKRLLAFEKRPFAFLALTMPITLAAAALSSVVCGGYFPGPLLSWTTSWLPVAHCGLFLSMALLSPGIFLIIMNLVTPTHVVFNSDGIKLVWKRKFLALTGPLWNWTNVIRADFVKHRDLLGEVELFEMEGFSKLPLVQRLVFLLRMTPCSYMMCGRFRLSLQHDGIAYGDQRTRLLQAIANFLPPDKMGPKLIERVERVSPSAKSGLETYTSIWLDALRSGSSKRVSTELLTPGTMLLDDSYRIEAEIGSGGQGVAYRALALGPRSQWSQMKSVVQTEKLDEDEFAQTDEHNWNVAAQRQVADMFQFAPQERVVVLKEFILPTSSTQAAAIKTLQSIEREAALLRKLEHPNIVELIDLFVEDQRAYLVMEHIDGLSLKRIVQENGPWHCDRVIAIALQLCAILEHLHKQDPPVIHRDFTPENILLTSSGQVKLIDFNVAQQVQANMTRTVVGKHAYIPPEQFRGRASIQSDIYALGATLFFLLTGQDPEPITTSHPIRVMAEVDLLFDEIVARATNVEAKLRYADASQLKAALTELAAKWQFAKESC